MSTFTFQLPPSEQEKLKAALNPQQLRQAEFQIVKRTTKALAGIIQSKVRENANIQLKYVKRVVTIVPPKGDPPEGRIVVKKELIPLIAFSPSASKRNGVRALLSKGRPPVVLRHAFIATMKSGHRGVFERAKHGPTKGANVFKTVTRGPTKGLLRYRIGRNGIAERLAIEELFGPSIFSLVKVPDMLQSIKFDAQAELRKQAASQLSRFAAQQPIVDEA